MAETNYLDDLNGKAIALNGTVVNPRRNTLNFVGAFTVADNALTLQTDVGGGGSSLAAGIFPEQLLEWDGAAWVGGVPPYLIGSARIGPPANYATSGDLRFSPVTAVVGLNAALTNDRHILSFGALGTDVVGLGDVNVTTVINGSTMNVAANALTILTTTCAISGIVDIIGATLRPPSTIAAATHAPVLTQRGVHFLYTHAALCTVTLPSDATSAFPIGTFITGTRYAAGAVTFAAGGGATVQSPGGLLSIAAQYDTVDAVKVASNTWLLRGPLA